MVQTMLDPGLEYQTIILGLNDRIWNMHLAPGRKPGSNQVHARLDPGSCQFETSCVATFLGVRTYVRVWLKPAVC